MNADRLAQTTDKHALMRSYIGWDKPQYIKALLARHQWSAEELWGFLMEAVRQDRVKVCALLLGSSDIDAAQHGHLALNAAITAKASKCVVLLAPLCDDPHEQDFALRLAVDGNDQSLCQLLLKAFHGLSEDPEELRAALIFAWSNHRHQSASVLQRYIGVDHVAQAIDDVIAARNNYAVWNAFCCCDNAGAGFALPTRTKNKMVEALLADPNGHVYLEKLPLSNKEPYLSARIAEYGAAHNRWELVLAFKENCPPHIKAKLTTQYENWLAQSWGTKTLSGSKYTL